MKNRNELRFYLQIGLFGTAQMMITGAIVQRFMIESGIGESKVW